MTLRGLMRGWGRHMTTTKSTSGPGAMRPDFGSVSVENIAPPQSDKPSKPVRRVVPKPFRPRVVGEAPAASAPPAILWDDPFDPTAESKPKG